MAKTTLSETGASPAWETLHRAFHASLLAGCRSGRLRFYCEQFFDTADRYRLVSRVAGSGTRDVSAEHGEITRAVLARDTEAAIKLSDDHVLRTEAIVRTAMQLKGL